MKKPKPNRERLQLDFILYSDGGSVESKGVVFNKRDWRGGNYWNKPALFTVKRVKLADAMFDVQIAKVSR